MGGKINLEETARKTMASDVNSRYFGLETLVLMENAGVTGLAGDFVQKEKGNYFTSTDVLEKLSEAIKWGEDF